MKRPLRTVCLMLMMLALPAMMSAQAIQTADQFFQTVSDNYASIKDYRGNISVTTNGQAMQGTVTYKAPNLLIVKFSSPAEQVICFDGQKLVVYIPSYRAVLEQDVSQSGAGTAGMATGEGLKVLKRGYTIAYDKDPVPVALEANSQEMVIKLKLSWKTSAEGFRQIIMSVDPKTLMIRRMDGAAVSGERIIFDFSNVKTNQGVPAQEFLYNPPGTANVYNNFLFKSDN